MERLFELESGVSLFPFPRRVSSAPAERIRSDTRAWVEFLESRPYVRVSWLKKTRGLNSRSPEDLCELLLNHSVGVLA